MPILNIKNWKIFKGTASKEVNENSNNWKLKYKSSFKSKTKNLNVREIYKVIIEHENVDSEYWDELHGSCDLFTKFQRFYLDKDWNDLEKDIFNWSQLQIELFIIGLNGIDHNLSQYNGKMHKRIPNIFNIFYKILELSHGKKLDCGDIYYLILETDDDFLNLFFEDLINYDLNNLLKYKHILQIFESTGSQNWQKINDLKQKIKKASR
jgi:hypothetical protein